MMEVQPRHGKAGVESDRPPPLEIHDMTVSYGRKPVLWDVDLAIPENELIAIVGPNGAGKSTLMKAVLGLVPKASGRVEIFGLPYEEQRSLVGYVPQRESVDWDFPVSTLDVVLMGRYGKVGWVRRPGRTHVEAAMHALEAVGLADMSRRQINQLSGGQQQRVFMARALAQDAKLYFMDEPFAGVDAATEQAILDMLRSLIAKKKTVVVVHHTLKTVEDYFDHLVLMNMRVIANGPVATTLTPENLDKTYGGRLSLLDRAAEAVRQAKR